MADADNLDWLPERVGDSPAIEDHREWFERLYVAAGQGAGTAPWDRGGPHPLFAQWAEDHGLTGGPNRRALVVGCGLGEDAEFLARLGFTTEAFDFATAAIRTVLERFPESPVRYSTADLLHPRREWLEAFDFVVESLTVQSLPRSFRAEAIARVREFVAPGGTLLVIAGAVGDDQAEEDASQGPWLLTKSDVESFAEGDVRLVRLERVAGDDIARWRAEFRRAEAVDE